MQRGQRALQPVGVACAKAPRKQPPDVVEKLELDPVWPEWREGGENSVS